MKRILFSLILLSLFGSSLYAQWGPDVRLTVNDSSSYNPQRCVAANGDMIHVVWTDTRDGNWEAYYKRSTDGGSSWGVDTRLTFDTAGSIYPSIAVSGSFLHVTWQDLRDGIGGEIYYKRSSDGGVNWGADTRLTYDSSISDIPSIASSGSNVFITWLDFRNYPAQIYYKVSNDGGLSWGPDTRLASNPYGPSDPIVAVSGSTIHLISRQFAGWLDDIHYTRSTDWGSTWSPDTFFASGDSGAEGPDIAASGSNVFIVRVNYWTGGSYRNLRYKCSTDGGLTWSPYSRLTNSPADARGPSVSVSGLNVHTVWHDERDGNQEIYYKRSTDFGMSWSADTRLTFNSASSFYPHVCVSGPQVHVVWIDNRDGNTEIYYKRNPTGNIGVEVSPKVTGPIIKDNFVAVPNPFKSFTSVFGRDRDRFILYDISGRKIGTYPGHRLGWDITPGVYFLRLEGSSTKPLRIVKLR